MIGQSKLTISSDSLLKKSFKYLSEKAKNPDVNKESRNSYGIAWLTKSKLEQNWSETANAYHTIMFLQNKKELPSYSDSLLFAAKKTKNPATIGAAYLTKGIIKYDQKQIKEALDYYILADSYLVLTEDQYDIYKVKYSIAHIKYYLGFYDEAISLFRECIDYFKTENDRAYLNSLHSLGLCYNRIGNFAWCTITNQLGIDEGKRLENITMEMYFVQSEGVNLYGHKMYKEAIKNLLEVLPFLVGKNDFANESVTYFYIAKSYQEIHDQPNAMLYYKKVDYIFQKNAYIRPDLRQAYEQLVSYYKKQNNDEQQLYYINRLLAVDKVLGQNYNYLLKKIVKEYDTKELIKSKAEIENKMTITAIVSVITILLLIVIIIFLLHRHFKNQRLFRQIMNRDTSISEVLNETQQKYKNQSFDSNIENTYCNENQRQESNGLSEEIEKVLIKQLAKFEQSKKYLEKDMTLAKMATYLNTNSKYVTKIVAQQKGKGTIEYITDLKIDYIVDRIKNDSKFRNYTNKALSEEAGFGSSQNFTRAFKIRIGFAPTYFIATLKRNYNNSI